MFFEDAALEVTGAYDTEPIPDDPEPTSLPDFLEGRRKQAQKFLLESGKEYGQKRMEYQPSMKNH